MMVNSLSHLAEFSWTVGAYCFPIIICCGRSENKSSIAAAVTSATKLRALYPNYLAGFDLVGHEDSGYPLVYFIDELMHASQSGVDLPYFLHAGETSK